MKPSNRAKHSEPLCSSPDRGDIEALAFDTGGTVLAPNHPGDICVSSTSPASLALGPHHGNLVVKRPERCMSVGRTNG